MKKHIAYEKLSKKEKRKINNGRRKTWGEINPVTRKPTNSKAYNRKKNQCWKDEFYSTDSFLRPSDAAGSDELTAVCALILFMIQ